MAALNPFSSASDNFGNRNSPPPPYDSIIHSGEGSGRGDSRDLDILVTDPVKQGDGVSAYVSFKVRTRTSNDKYKRPASEVIRRFRDFSWLHHQLTEKNKGIIVPALPEKSAMQKFQMSTEFIEQRRRALQVFINKIAAHPVLKESRELQIFLEANEEEWALEMAKAQAETAVTNKKMDGAFQWFKTLQHSASNVLAGKSDESAEDPEYIKVKEYITNLEGHLAEAHRQAGRLIKKENELGVALADFGSAAEQLGRHEEGDLQKALSLLCTKANQVAQMSKERSELLTNNFELPFKEFTRTISSVRHAMADRSASLSALQQAKSDMDTKKVKLNKLRATPGSKDDKVAEAERDLNEADQRVKNAKIAYESIVARMTEELNRFQKERAADMNTVLRDFALAQAQIAAESAKAWTTLLTELQGFAP